MQPYKNFSRNLLASLVLSYLLPVVLVAATGLGLSAYTDFSTNMIAQISLAAGLIYAIFTAGAVKRLFSSRVNLLYRHIIEISDGNLSFRTTVKTGGVFGYLAKKLNGVSDKFQEFLSRSQAESAVITSEANRLRSVINSIEDGVFALDRDRRIILFNKAAMKISGFSIEQAAGRPVSQIVPLQKGSQLILEEWLDANEEKALSQSAWENISLKSRDGKEHSLDVDVLYQGADPNGIRTLVTFHDRTQAQEVEDMKVDFVALAAHELRTPITVIRGYLEILDEELGSKLSPENKEFMRKLNLSASQLSGFINNILNVSRIEHGNLNLKMEKTDWLQVLRATTETLLPKAELQRKKIVLELPQELPAVSVDKVSIVEVINNLVDNAIKYSGPETTITVCAQVKDQTVETTVADQGLGIPENALDKLFSKFYRSHRTRSSHQGTGLGLYMSKGIIEAHGGSIWVHTKENEGSTFGFFLPIYKEVAGEDQTSDNRIVRGIHGWIKNHTLYRG